MRAAGHAGLFASQGSNSSRFPPGVRIRNVECPSQVISSFPTGLMLTAFSDAVNACQSVLAAEARGRGVLNAEIAGIAGDHSRGDALRAMQHRRRRSHKRVTLSDDVCELCADGAVGRGTRPDTA